MSSYFVRRYRMFTKFPILELFDTNIFEKMNPIMIKNHPEMSHIALNIY